MPTLATVGEVKALAKDVWPAAVTINVQPVDATADTPKQYRLFALGERSRLLGRMSANSLGELREQLQSRAAGILGRE